MSCRCKQRHDLVLGVDMRGGPALGLAEYPGLRKLRGRIHPQQVGGEGMARQSGSEGPSIRIRIRDRVVAIVFLLIDAGKRYV